MKLLNRADFMAMPAGTVFHRFGGDAAGNVTCEDRQILQKDETWPSPAPGLMGTYTYEFLDIEGADPCELHRIQHEMLHTGASVPFTPIGMRCSAYDPTDLFLVYEAQDIIRLADMLANGLRAIAGTPLYPHRHT